MDGSSAFQGSLDRLVFSKVLGSLVFSKSLGHSDIWSFRVGRWLLVRGHYVFFKELMNAGAFRDVGCLF